LLLAASLTLAVGPACAQASQESGQAVASPADAGPVDTRWGVGLAVGSDNRPYRDLERKADILPAIVYENRWLRVAGPGVEFKLARVEQVALGLTLSYARDGYDPDDSPALAGMASRRASAWIGLRASLRGTLGTVTTEWSRDAASHSRGNKLRLSVDRRYTVGDFGLTPRLSATWLDRQFVQYYYGVLASEVQAGRSLYTPGSTVNVDAGLRVDWRLDAQQTLFVDAGLTRFGSGIRNSPLVDRATLPSARLGWITRF
jgi:outer membrane protein